MGHSAETRLGPPRIERGVLEQGNCAGRLFYSIWRKAGSYLWMGLAIDSQNNSEEKTIQRERTAECSAQILPNVCLPARP